LPPIKLTVEDIFGSGNDQHILETKKRAMFAKWTEKAFEYT
jgi:hypothetical protein